MNFNEQLAKIIKSLNLPNLEVAKKLGISEQALDKILKQITKIDVKDFEKYAKKLGVDPSKVLKNIDVKDVIKDIQKGDLGSLAKDLLKKKS